VGKSLRLGSCAANSLVPIPVPCCACLAAHNDAHQQPKPTAPTSSVLPHQLASVYSSALRCTALHCTPHLTSPHHTTPSPTTLLLTSLSLPIYYGLSICHSRPPLFSPTETLLIITSFIILVIVPRPQVRFSITLANPSLRIPTTFTAPSLQALCRGQYPGSPCPFPGSFLRKEPEQAYKVRRRPDGWRRCCPIQKSHSISLAQSPWEPSRTQSQAQWFQRLSCTKSIPHFFEEEYL